MTEPADSVTMSITIELPESIQRFIEVIQGYACITDWYDHTILVEFEEPSEFDIGVKVTELKHEIDTLGLT